MPRYIPIALKDHIRQGATTTCILLKIIPVSQGYPVYGVTSLDRDVIYDDGNGPLKYSAAVGTQPSALQGRADISVDNAQATSLMSEFDVPVSEADIRAGAYDFATYRLYFVNYADLSQGHVYLRGGTIGQVTIDATGLSFVNELRGLTAELKQSVCEKDSLSCRAIFGTQPIGGSTPGQQVRYGWCGFDAESLLVPGTVSSVSLENTITFTVSGFSMAEDELAPGIAIFTSGLNSGRTYEIESNTAAGEITLAFPTTFPISPGDTLEYRPDCNKQARDSEKGCLHWFSSDWVLHFRGEPDIPIGDAGSMEVPGASSPPGGGGSTYQPIQEE